MNDNQQPRLVASWTRSLAIFSVAATLLTVGVSGGSVAAANDPASQPERTPEDVPLPEGAIDLHQVEGMTPVDVLRETVRRVHPDTGERVRVSRVRITYEAVHDTLRAEPVMHEEPDEEQAYLQCWVDHEVYPLTLQSSPGGQAYVSGTANVQTSCPSASYTHYLGMYLVGSGWINRDQANGTAYSWDPDGTWTYVGRDCASTTYTSWQNYTSGSAAEYDNFNCRV